jgi:hypothetical protein
MSVVAFKIDPGKDAFQQDYLANGAKLPGAGLQWLETRRAKAMEAFGKIGVPNRRVEAWKYTDLSAALEGDLEPAMPFRGTVSASEVFGAIAGGRAVLANGLVHSIENAGSGIEIYDLASLDAGAPDWVKEHLGRHAAGAAQILGAASLGLMRGGVALRQLLGWGPRPALCGCARVHPRNQGGGRPPVARGPRLHLRVVHHQPRRATRRAVARLQPARNHRAAHP